MAKDLAIVLNNGSLNSAVTTALAAQRHRVVLLFAHTGDPADSGDAAAGPRAAFDRQVAHFKPYRDHVLDLSFLTDARDGHGRPPAGTGADPRQVPPVGPKLLDLVPLVGIALRFAAHHSAGAVHLGLRVGPGGDPLVGATEFGQIWSELIQMPCGLTDLSVEQPLLELEPWQVVDVGVQAGVPVRPDVELRRPRPRTLLGLPRLPRAGGRLPPGRQTRPAPRRAEGVKADRRTKATRSDRPAPARSAFVVLRSTRTPASPGR